MANPAKSGHVTGIILAAGLSSRLGRPKQLLDFRGEPLIRRVVARVLSSTLDQVIVVTGGSSDEVRSSLSGLSVEIVFNPDFVLGQSTSLRAGLNACASDTDAVVVMLGDQPDVDPTMIDTVIATWRESGNSIVQARYRGVRSHPVLFARSMFPELLHVTGDSGASSVLKRHQHEIVPVDVDRDVPQDIDSEEDYRIALARF